MAKMGRVTLFPLAIAAALLLPAVSRAQGCGTWLYGRVTPSGSGVAYGNGTVVVAGDGAFVSKNGAPWRWVPAGSSRWLPGVRDAHMAFGAGRFVAVGASTIIVSEDGVSWRQVASPAAALGDVAWSGSLFVAVGSVFYGPYVVMTSPDGLEWRTTEQPSNVSLVVVRWGGSQWIGGAIDGLFTSPDGVTWTQRVGGGINISAVGWNGSQYLAVGTDADANPVIATSADGTQWTIRSFATAYAQGVVATNGQTWVLTTGGASLLTSTDGVSWQSADLPASLSLQDVVWTGSEFVAVGEGGVATSVDGKDWSSQLLIDFAAAIWAGDHFVAVGKVETTAQGAAYTSADGLVWTPAAIPPATPAVALAWTGSQLVAVGLRGGVYTSPTGDVWTRQTVPAGVATTDLNSVAWSGSTLVAVGARTALVSTDGAAWTSLALPGYFLDGVTWGAGQFVAVGYSPTSGGLPPLYQPIIVTSPDALSWTQQPLSESDTTSFDTPLLIGVAWNGIQFVTVGERRLNSGYQVPLVAISTDGAAWSWSDVSSQGVAPLASVSWTGVGFYAVGLGGQLFASLDGLAWTLDTQFVYRSVTGVAGNGRQLVVVGSGGATAQTTCTAAPPIGQSGVSNATVVTAARTPGLAGTQWATDVELFNASGSAATALLYYLPRDTDNSIATRRAVSVPAGQAVRLTDVVGRLFGLSNSAGALIVSSTQPLLVTSRTATGSSSGTFGQFVPGLPEGAALITGQEGRLIQLSENASYRTNVGFASISAVPLLVTVKLYSSSGELLGTLPVTLPPFGSAQVTEILPKLGVASVDDAYAVVRSDTAGAEYYAYASVVDNVSGDPLTVLPVQASTATPLYLPAVAHNPGLNGTMWRTDLEVHNPGAVQAVYKLELLKSGQDNTTPGAANFMLDPGTSHRYLDVVKDIFGFEGSGAIRVTPSSGAVMATARSFTDTGSGSRGQFIPATPLSQAIATPTGARLIQLSHAASATSGFRTNVGFVNATGSPITVQADLYSASGTWLGAGVNTLAPFEFIQDTGIFGTVTTGDVPDGFAVVTSSTANARFFAYASVIDNQSGAPVYIPAQ